MQRQENFVTKAAIKRLLGPPSPRMPSMPRDTLEWLEANYPPKCYEPGRETLEAHLQYAGKVDLVQFLRASYSETTDDIAMSALTDDNSIAAMIEREYLGHEGTD